MLIIAIILFGMLVGAGAQLIVKGGGRIDWTMAIVAGLAGSFVGGLLISFFSGDGLELRPSGLLGSLAGAILVTAAMLWWRDRSRKAKAAARS